MEVLVRPASLQKPSVQKLQEQGIKIWSIDLDQSSELVTALIGVDTLISAIGPNDLLQQKKLLQSAKDAGVKRIVPCAFITVAPPQGAMRLRDEVCIKRAHENDQFERWLTSKNRKRRYTMPSSS